MCQKILLLLLILTVMLIPCTAEAASSVDVTITATGVVIAPPSGFTVIYVSDFETSLSWVNPAGSMATMVRAAYGHAPTSMTDGYLVYQGAGTSFNDTSASLTSPDVIYYRAWAQRASDGQWGVLYAEDDTEDIMSLSFLFVGIIILILATFGLATAGFLTKRKLLLALAGLLSIIIAITCGSTLNFPMANQLIIFSLIFAVAMFLSPIYFRDKKTVVPPAEISHSDHLYNEAERVRKLRGKHSLKNQKGIFD